MKKNKPDSLPVKAVLSGVLASMGISLVLLCVEASLLIGGRVGEDKLQILGNGAAFAAAIAGGILAALMSEKKILIPIISGSIFWLLLLGCGMLFFEGKVENAGITALAIASGSCIVCATCMKKPRKKGYKKLRAR